MLLPINSTRMCKMFVRQVRQPLLRNTTIRRNRATTAFVSDHGEKLPPIPTTASNPPLSLTSSRHFYRNYRNDFFANYSILSSSFAPRFHWDTAPLLSYLRCASSTNCDYQQQQRRHFHYNYGLVGFARRRTFYTSSSRRATDRDEAKSKVERTLALVKEELEARERETKELERVNEEAKLLKKQSVWKRVVTECKHYYHGFRLLGADFRLSARLLWQLLHGHTLSRKEKRQLVRSVSDLFRLVPFLIFVIVPFMEFALPIFLKFFPSMLPSTFQEQSKESEKVRKHLKVKLEMAKFLQATMEEMSLERQKLKEGGSKVKEFSDFLKKIREERGGYVSNEELLKFVKLFEDELTLDNLTRQQLIALCRIVGLQPIGTSNMLRFQLNMKLRELKADDKLISAEGIDTLSVMELQQACRARGMRSIGVSEQRLKSQLNQWLELSLSEQVPPSLLLLSSTLYLPMEVSFTDRLTTLMTTLPTHLAEEVKIKLADLEGAKVDNKVRLDIVKSIEAAMKKEREEEKRSAEEEKMKAEALKQDILKKMPAQQFEELLDKAPTIMDAATSAAAAAATSKKEIDLRELEPIEELISDAARGKLAEEKEDLQELKRDIQDHKEDVSEVQALMVLKGEKMRESKAAKRLQATVDRMISRADRLFDKLQVEKQHLKEEMNEATTNGEEKAKKDIVFINDMLLSLRKLQKLPDDTKVQRVVDVLEALDEDHDGAIDVNLALRVIELLGQENVKISHDQMSRICALLKKESLVDGLEHVQQQQPLNSASATAGSFKEPVSETTTEEEKSKNADSTPSSSSPNVETEKRKERVAQ